MILPCSELLCEDSSILFFHFLFYWLTKKIACFHPWYDLFLRGEAMEIRNAKMWRIGERSKDAIARMLPVYNTLFAQGSSTGSRFRKSRYFPFQEDEKSEKALSRISLRGYSCVQSQDITAILRSFDPRARYCLREVNRALCRYLAANSLIHERDEIWRLSKRCR